jgi:hypothetical protein
MKRRALVYWLRYKRLDLGYRDFISLIVINFLFSLVLRAQVDTLPIMVNKVEFNESFRKSSLYYQEASVLGSGSIVLLGLGTVFIVGNNVAGGKVVFGFGMGLNALYWYYRYKGNQYYIKGLEEQSRGKNFF